MKLAGLFAALAGVGAAIFFSRGDVEEWGPLEVRPNLEQLKADGSRYTPSTQSFLRGQHWLDEVREASVALADDDTARVTLRAGGDELTVVGLPFDQLVPRLHYAPADPPDEFDAFNLRLAEYSRNSLSVPAGAPGDSMAHFETTLEEERPYRLGGDYEFLPNRRFRPIRFAVINNCLGPALWELSATDRSGEIYHAWFRLPDDAYARLVARTNGVTEGFARAAVAWTTEEVPLRPERLRRTVGDDHPVPAALHAGDRSGYSTQDSRRKLAAGYALVERGAELAKPRLLDELTAHPVHLSSFVEPGLYAADDRRRFDLSFLRGIAGARVRRVEALTSYRAGEAGPPRAAVEIEIDLGEWRLLLGNLAPELLVPQEDLALHGFGVGILASGGLAERRGFLISDGPAPAFVYLCRVRDGRLFAVNSHEFGVEQVFVRTHVQADPPWWEITLTSYERIVDIVKYRVEVPVPLRAELRERAANYAAPLYRTYRDDNLR